MIIIIAACAVSGLLVAACSSSAPGVASRQARMAPTATGAHAKAAAGAGSPRFSTSSGASNSGASHGGVPIAAYLTRIAPSQNIIYIANLTLRVRNVDAVAAVATNDVAGVGGYVASEQETSQIGPGSVGQVSLELKIPVAAYHSVLAELALLGRHLVFNQQAQDVTQQVADVSSRVTSAEAAIKQLRALLSQAGGVGQLLLVQNEINSQESALESLIAQQQALAHETTYATVYLTVLGHHVPVKKKPKPAKKVHRGLVAGLSTGWRALKAVVVWLLTVLGTLLPFAAPIVVIGGIIYVGRRRLSRRRTPPTAIPPAAVPPAATS